MLRFRPHVLVGLALASVFALSSCGVVDDLVGETPGNGTGQEDINGGDNGAGTNGDANGGEEDEDAEEGLNCESIYSPGQVAAFTDQGREFLDSEPTGGYGWGTINPDLVTILKDVRADLKVSCTWILPDTESGSTTTLAIVPTERLQEIEDILRLDVSTSQPLGEGTLWKVDQNSSNLSGDYEVNETHFLTAVTCPESLAEPECTLWITSTFSFGSSEALTRDAAEVLGKL
jgi:hypothetical protein